MTTTNTAMKDLRKLCENAIQLWDADCDMDGVINEMRTALAQPEPEVSPWPVPGDAEGLAEVFWGRYDQTELEAEELAQLIYEQAMIPAAEHCKTEVPAWTERGNSFAQDNARDCARAVLTRYARPAIKPVPVAERPWKREGWCDGEGICWWWRPDTPEGNAAWVPATTALVDELVGVGFFVYSLPHHALPVPGAEVG